MKSKNEIKIVNVHCHFMTYDYLPDLYTKKLTKQNIGITIGESCAKKLAAILPCRLGRFLKSLNDDNAYSEKGAVRNYLTAGEYLCGKVRKSKYVYEFIAPLMIDMVTASNIYIVTETDGVISYNEQIEEYSKQIKKYPGKIFASVMFNPMREDSLDLCQRAVSGQGFIGAKMYPAMGFYADPARNVYHNCRWKDDCKNRRECAVSQKINSKSLCHQSLEAFYEWAQEKELPITVHSQYEAMQNLVLELDEACKYTDISDWGYILEKYDKIRINFSHFGGTGFIKCKNFKKDKDKKKKYEYSVRCKNDIYKLINCYNKKYMRVFADVSANAFCFPSRRKEYFKYLNSALKHFPDAIMFGTDTPAISFKITDSKYIKHFVNNIEDCPYLKDNFFSENAKKFLFGKNKELPKEYVNFIDSSIDRAENITQKADGSYSIV